ncbi:hypothetical protein EYZ11_010992 [Aspergillus tanneri]|nr:hypothetical protein EYZ11_010992 [Aspergillus tanneri]
MSVDEMSLKDSSCTSCAVTQDKSAYWTPALYFMYENGDTELVEQVGGMLAYYLLYGENVTAFPENFRMIAGDQYMRNFPWPVPDPPKSEWTGNQASQDALRQKALGFNCLNYNADPEPSLGRHYLPAKDYLDQHCPDGIRIEIMFPSCWNGKDTDSADHKSHVAYPSLVMDGTCPEGYETRVVSLFYETIWNTNAFKDKKGSFVISNGDPTGYGYHADFIHGWESGILEQAVERCTNPSGQVTDCDVFNVQSESEQRKCTFDLPNALKDENVFKVPGSLPNKLAVQHGPAYASPVLYADGGAPSTAQDPPKPTQAPTKAPTPITSYVHATVTQAIVYVEQDIIIYVDGQGNPLRTESGTPETISTKTTTVDQVVSTVVSTPTDPPAKRDGHARMHKPHRHGHHGH